MDKQEIILDFGSGNTCRNNMTIIKSMIDELCRVDTRKHKVIIKWQLFKKAGDNIPLNRESFEYACNYAKKCGYQTTASVFDFESFVFLKRFKDIPFIKIANNPSIYYLQKYIQAYNIPTYISVSSQDEYNKLTKEYEEGKTNNFEIFCCVSKYPALGTEYQNIFNEIQLKNSISDHTTTFKMFDLYKPRKIEWHYKLIDSIGLDSGDFARTPQMLKEVL